MMCEAESDKIESDISVIFGKIVKFIKKKCKEGGTSVSFKELPMKEDKEGKKSKHNNQSVRVEPISLQRVDIKAYKDYTINGLKFKEDELLDEALKNNKKETLKQLFGFKHILEDR